MDALSTLFERLLRERRYLKIVTPKTVVWYETAFLACVEPSHYQVPVI